MIALVLGVVVGATDQTTVAAALPRIAAELGGVPRYAWIATSYLLASTVLVPVYGVLSDRLSVRRLLMVAMVVFLAGSLACAVAGSWGDVPLVGDGMNQLIAARALQGAGGAGLFALASIVLGLLYPPRERGRYQGWLAAAFAVAVVLGPWLGGLLADHAGSWVAGVEGWRWVFLINLPLGLVTLLIVLLHMPDLSAARGPASFEAVSAALMVATVVPLVLGLQLDKSVHPWGGATTPSLLGVAAVGGLAFVLHASRTRRGMLDVRLFRDRVFSHALATSALVGCVLVCTVLFLPLALVQVFGMSAAAAGSSLIPLSLAALTSAVSAGLYASRSGRYRPQLVLGTVLVVAGMVMLSGIDDVDPLWSVTLAMVLTGLGLGPMLTLTTLAIQNAVPLERLGQATGAAQFARQIGGVVGAAALGSMLIAGLSASLASDVGAPEDAALAGLGAEQLERLRDTAGDEFEHEVHELLGEVVADFMAVAATGDPALVAAALEATPLPFVTQQLLLGEAMAAAGDEERLRALELDLRARLLAREAEIVAAARVAVREAFEDGLRRAFRWLSVVAVVAVPVSATIPSRPLRSGHVRASRAASD